jgi:osmotically-inducible protein OsmY
MTKARNLDAEIKESVTRELAADALADVADIGVEVKQGVVTVSGVVDSWAKRVAAVKAAHRVHGVLDVVDDVFVRWPGAAERKDVEVAQAVRHALKWDVFVPEESIASTVNEGWVVLDGKVTSWAERDAAARAIQNLAGVRGVTNKLEVEPPAVSALELRDAIEDALERRAAREAARVSVTVEDGMVTVAGAVDSWPEKQAVLGAVKGTRGVGAVNDELRVTPHAL